MASPRKITLYPAIDLKAGEVVRLLHGDMAQATIYNADPGAQARQFADAGAGWIHVVDLDGAVAGGGADSNRAALRDIIAAKIPVQFGGGVRDMGAVERAFAEGVARVVLGTAALKNPDLVKEAAKEYPNRIAIAADARDGMVAVEGWVEASTIAVTDLAARFEDCGVAAMIFTDIGRDGALTGINLGATAALARMTRLPVIASGGVAGMDDLRALANDDSGIAGVITGRALYDGRLNLGEALKLLGGAG